MLDIAVHVLAIAAVIGYVEYRLRSYAALMARLDHLAIKQLDGMLSIAERIDHDSQALAQKVAVDLDKHQLKMNHTLATMVEEHEAEIVEVHRTSIREMRDTVGASLKSFSDSVWKGVHNMAQSLALPASPIFTCYYCGQKFPVTMRERIGTNDYCPDHGNKRKAAVRPGPEVTNDDRARLHTANSGSKHPDNDKLPWIS
jgi:hypothetical protein